jgi:hypothetical protein
VCTENMCRQQELGQMLSARVLEMVTSDVDVVMEDNLT